jgi:spermidine/putrescine transport system permease protein
MIANIVANLFGADYNWPLGAAVAVLILVMVLVILTVTQRLERRWRVA